MYTSKDIAEYYNTTQIHYEKWWGLKKGLSLHYGIWEEGTKTFNESLNNTNKVLMELSKISESDKVLDAGCGVGGAAIFLHKHKNVDVIGITLSEKQLDFANAAAKERIGNKENTLSDNKSNWVTFPNPAAESITITSYERENVDVVVEIFDVFGNRIISSNEKSQYKSNIELDVSDLPNGVFFLNVRNSNVSILYTQRIVINH